MTLVGLLFYLFTVLANATSAAAANVSLAANADYFQLIKYATLASTSYCIEDLGLGLFRGQRCVSYACGAESLSTVEIVHIFNFLGWFDVGSGLAAVDKTTQTIYLSFRGTITGQDWTNNMIAIPVDYSPMVTGDGGFDVKLDKSCSGCKVHKGFNAYVKSNAKAVIKRVVELKEQYRGYRVVVTGHSLGAAIAIFTGIELRLLGYDTLVVTLAGPKIGNDKFAEYVDDLFNTNDVVKHISSKHSFDDLSTGLVRMVHVHDIVPNLPPLRWFKHSGYEYYLSNKGYNQRPSSVERRGLDYVEESDLATYRELLPSAFSRFDHVSYFFKVTTCLADDTYATP